MKMKRRKLLTTMGAAGVASIIGCNVKPENEVTSFNPELALEGFSAKDLKGNINHSACRWCYSKIPLEELVESAKAIGLKSIELLNPDEWDIALNKGLTCAVSNGSPLGITKGWNDPSLHEQLTKDLSAIIPLAAEKGIPQVIVFAGNRNGMDDQVGLENCAKGLEPIVKLAEKHGVGIVMELLNSKIDHADYMCDHTAWGVDLAKKIGSSNFKLLYDIYHMQIMEGDVIRTIKENIDYISHFHTGGVPGRKEINQTQELFYPAIMKAIKETGFKGFVAQEFIPTRMNPLTSLKEGVKTCDV
ncbi:MAG: TIM barrel protein [Bacteroidota bacterium]